MSTYVSAESYKHKFAKKTLAQWLREVAAMDDSGVDRVCLSPIDWKVNRGGPHYGVWTEYPICVNDNNSIVGEQSWDEYHWGDPRFVFEKHAPSYDEVIAMGLLPIVIFDVAVQQKGIIVYGLEVVHRHGISQTKLAYLKRVGIPTYAIDADWILSQSRRPKKLVCDLVWGR